MTSLGYEIDSTHCMDYLATHSFAVSFAGSIRLNDLRVL